MTALSFVRNEVVGLLSDNVGSAYAVAVLELESALISEALISTRGNQADAANLLGIHRTTLRKRIALIKKHKASNTTNRQAA